METKNICGKIPVELHEKVREELEGTEMTIPQFLQKVIEEHFMKKGVEKMEAKTLAVQVSEELFNRLKERVEKEKRQRRGRFTQKDYLIEIITQALDAADELEKQDEDEPELHVTQAQVMRMIRQKDIRDDNGELLKFGTHIFRHCYGKKLTELHIEDWMIARLLGHKTLQSVHHYRRIGNKVMADETRKTREKMDLILMDIIKGWDGYEL